MSTSTYGGGSWEGSDKPSIWDAPLRWNGQAAAALEEAQPDKPKTVTIRQDTWDQLHTLAVELQHLDHPGAERRAGQRLEEILSHG